MKINIEDIKKHMDFQKKVNCDVELDEIDFYENGEKVEISKEIIDDWEYTGLSNIHFITSLAYTQKPKKDAGPDFLDCKKLKLGNGC